jgi:hypothetical protein
MVVALQLRVETAGLCSECGRIKVMATAVASKTTCKASNLYVVDPWSVLLLAFDDAAHAGDNHVQDRLRRVSANHHFYPDAADTVDELQALPVVPLGPCFVDHGLPTAVSITIDPVDRWGVNGLLLVQVL